MKAGALLKIIRANADDTDIFSGEELSFGACCFCTEDKAFRYYFKINGRAATLYANTDEYIRDAIDEFLFYSGFILAIKDPQGRILLERTQNEPYILKIGKIQPSQFYVSQGKLDACKRWIKGPEDILIPIAIRNGVSISLDGHTRLRAALDLGYDSVYVYPTEYDDSIFLFVDEAIRRQITGVFDMKLVSDEEYKEKWDAFCDDLLEGINERPHRPARGEGCREGGE